MMCPTPLNEKPFLAGIKGDKTVYVYHIRPCNQCYEGEVWGSAD